MKESPRTRIRSLQPSTIDHPCQRTSSSGVHIQWDVHSGVKQSGGFIKGLLFVQGSEWLFLANNNARLIDGRRRAPHHILRKIREDDGIGTCPLVHHRNIVDYTSQ